MKNKPLLKERYAFGHILPVLFFCLLLVEAMPARAQVKPVPVALNIKDDLYHESLKGVLVDIKNLKEGKVGAILARFSGADARWVWKVREGYLPSHTNAITEMKPGGVVTTLNYGNLRGATKLSVARTLIHEMIHAYLVLYFRYDSSANATYPRMVAAYRAQIPAPQLNDVHHQEMATSFVDEIALALREYGRKLGLGVEASVYTDLAWGGLDYRNSNSLAEDSKQRIQSRLAAEQTDAPIQSIISAVGPPMGE